MDEHERTSAEREVPQDSNGGDQETGNGGQENGAGNVGNEGGNRDAEGSTATSKFPEAKEGCKLFIAQLDYGTMDATLESAFSKYGRIVDCHIARQAGGVSRGFGFVTYDDPRDAEDALERY